MARVPTTSNRTRAGVGSDPGTITPDVSVNLGNASQELDQFLGGIRRSEARHQARVNAVERTRAIGTYTRELNDEMRRLETEDDITRTNTIQNFGRYAQEQMNQLLQNHPGDDESRLALEQRLEAARIEAADRMASRSLEAQRQMVSSALNDQLDVVSLYAADNPDKIVEAFTRWDGIVDDMAPALKPHEERVFREAGRSKVALNAIDRRLETQDIGSAEAILNTPGVKEAIGADTVRKVETRIGKIRSDQTKAERELTAKAKAYERVLGRPFSEDEKLRFLDIAPSDPGNQTLADKISELETALKRPLTEKEILDLGDIEAAQGGSFGKSLRGRAHDAVVQMAPAFSAGLLTPEEERRFTSAVQILGTPRQIPNPDTGVVETIPGQIPPFVTEAYERRGMPVPVRSGTLAGAEGPGGAGVPDVPNAGLGGGAPGAPGASRVGTAGPLDPSAPPPPPEKTVFGMAGLVAGPVSAIGSSLGRVPVLGDVFRIAPQMTRARNFVPLLQREMVKVLQNNPKYAEGERQAIEKEISINPELLDTPNNFRDRLIGMDDALQIRERNAFQTAQNKFVSREERQQALNVYNAIVKFRMNLGVPPRFDSPKEVRKAIAEGGLRPGDVFYDSKLNLRQVPEGNADATGE